MDERAVIRAAIEQWASHGLPWMLYPLPEAAKDALADRIYEALGSREEGGNEH
jgi:hypothetical protein